MSVPFLTMGSSFSPNLMKEVPSVKEEQRMVETLWAASERVHEEDRRREVCNLWIDYHEHLCGVFRSHVAHHEEERRRYECLLQSMYTTDKGAA